MCATQGRCAGRRRSALNVHVVPGSPDGYEEEGVESLVADDEITAASGRVVSVGHGGVEVPQLVPFPVPPLEHLPPIPLLAASACFFEATEFDTDARHVRGELPATVLLQLCQGTELSSLRLEQLLGCRDVGKQGLIVAPINIGGVRRI